MNLPSIYITVPCIDIQNFIYHVQIVINYENNSRLYIYIKVSCAEKTLTTFLSFFLPFCILMVLGSQKDRFKMRKGKVVIKKLDDKVKRQVTFAKRKKSLMKKARELSVLCDVPIVLIIFSQTDKLYSFCSQSTRLTCVYSPIYIQNHTCVFLLYICVIESCVCVFLLQQNKLKETRALFIVISKSLFISVTLHFMCGFGHPFFCATRPSITLTLVLHHLESLYAFFDKKEVYMLSLFEFSFESYKIQSNK